jgi:hypothetical protein
MEHKTTTEFSASTRVIRLCEGGWWLPVYNDIVDETLTRLSGGALRVLWFIVGLSWVPQPDGEPDLHL